MRVICDFCGSTTTTSRNKAEQNDKHFCNRKCFNRYKAADGRIRMERLNLIVGILLDEKEIGKMDLNKIYLPEISEHTIRKHMRTLEDRGIIKIDVDITRPNNKSKYILSDYMKRNFNIS